MAYPTTLALITALWSGPARTKSIALWAATGGAISPLGPLCAGILLEHYWWGSVFLLTAAARADRARDGGPARAEPREREHGAGRPRGRRALHLPRRRADPGDQLRRRAERDDPDPEPVHRRRRRSDRLHHPPAPRAEPALRPARRRAPDVLGRGVRGADRVRLAHGSDVHRAAVPAERARLLDGRGGPGDPAGRGVHGRGRAAVRQARRGPRRAVHAAVRLRLRAPRLPDHAAAVEGEHLLLEGRARLRLRRDRRRPRRHSRLALADRLGARSSAWEWPPAPPTCSATSAARSCSRSSARC